jgi:hypothetical protein
VVAVRSLVVEAAALMAGVLLWWRLRLRAGAVVAAVAALVAAVALW